LRRKIADFIIDSQMQGRSLIPIFLLLLLGCKHQTANVGPVKTSAPSQHTASIAQNPSQKPHNPAFPYRPSETKSFDLIHTQLEVALNWEKEQLNGKAILTIQPWFSPQSQLVLDAKGFLIDDISMAMDGNRKSLKYQYDNTKITIKLDRAYTRDETLKVAIRYTARPTELDSLVSEEDANDPGLYFINPRGEQPGKPRQAWTQGESHGSPGWFPTFDSPNQRCTSDIAITVADSFETLSNGLLVKSEQKSNGMRTDHWVMDQPHAPYLFMMAIGNYAIVKDEWRGREVSYYVEPAFEPYARLVFGKTPEMMEFFSNRLGVDYPWKKYAQVVVRDFISGAMENTSATTHFDRLQHDAREHLDNTYEDIVSHELFHQWFGDLVTCESWANLSLNEGFATYGEYLWKEYKYGYDDATAHLLDDRGAYLRSAARQKHPVIRYHHATADDLFDAHSYQKGGQILHMLRKLVGDEAFFATLKHYLTENAYDDVEIHELRLAFEEITGQDLNWFFDQWYLCSGHPEIEITHGYENGEYTLRLQQIQDQTKYPVFRLPLTVELVYKGEAEQVQVWMETADTTYRFPRNKIPDYVLVDPELDILMEVKREQRLNDAMLLRQALTAKGFARKAAAMDVIDFNQLSDSALHQIVALANDPFWGTRTKLLEELEAAITGGKPDALNMGIGYLRDPNTHLRISATLFLHSNLGTMPEVMKPAAAEALLAGILDSSYTVSQFALETYYALAPDAGLARTKELMENPEPHLIGMISKILKDAGAPEALPFIRTHLFSANTESGAKVTMLRGFGEYLNARPSEEKEAGKKMLMRVIEEKTGRWLRFTALQALADLEKTDELRAYFEDRSKIEDDQMIKTLIQRYLTSN
jgi:aminopeptidase N